MGKFGKKNEINLNPLSYNIGIIGEAGIGKSTLIKEMCEKLVGEDGYIAFDVGKEMGHSAISKIVTESIPDWAKFEEVIDDIVENKQADYPQLKAVIIDTYDQLCELAEKEAIRLWNKKLKQQDKPPVDTINSAYGGFGKGLDKAIDLMLDKLWELKSVGVSFIIVAHVKRSDLVDPVTEETYSILTSNTTQRYFNAIKQKLDFLGVAYIDRDIVKYKSGKKDNKGREIEKGKLTSESRVISFRDDTYSVDSKCRFAEIEDKIPFNVDAFIKAMQDAILAEQKKDGISLKDAKKKQEKEAAEFEKIAEENSAKAKKFRIDEEMNQDLLNTIKAKYPDTSDKNKVKIKKIMAEYGIENFKTVDVPTAGLLEIVDILND